MFAHEQPKFTQTLISICRLLLSHTTSAFDLGLGSCLQLAYVKQVIHSRLTSWKATPHFVAGEQLRDISRNCSLLLAAL